LIRRGRALARCLAARHVTGKYVISDKPMTEEQWIRERATVIDGEATENTPESPYLEGLN
jgi:hypothetical protein